MKTNSIKALRKIDNFFFVEGEGYASDRILFYGQYVLFIGITLIAVL